VKWCVRSRFESGFRDLSFILIHSSFRLLTFFANIYTGSRLPDDIKDNTMKKLFILILLLAGTAFAQEKFEIKDASKTYDVRLAVAKCSDGTCEGHVTVTLFKKGSTAPAQVFKLADTSFMLENDGTAPVNDMLLYDKQSALNFGDFNFDGVEDLAICDGHNGAYGMPSYQVYLYTPATKRFVRNAGLTKLGQENLGMFEVDKERKMISTFSKSGCCWHISEEYKIVNNRPVKVFEEVEDATIPDESKVKITTKRLVEGKWKTTVKYIKREG
jgi:hypothetical protein